MGLFAKAKEKLFGAEEVPAEKQFYSPLRVGLHTTLRLTLADLFIHVNELNPAVKLGDIGDLVVVSIGWIENDDGSYIYRFYCQNEKENQYIVQVYCGYDQLNPDEEKVDEVVLFWPQECATPYTDDGVKLMTNQTFVDNDKIYNRVWGPDMVVFEEASVDRTGEISEYVNHWMLHERDITEDLKEFLLVGMEEFQETGEVTTFKYIGINLPTQALTVQ